ncbi:DUF1127 domain-containing protein [Pelagovum pacificum]|uniref:DUF1127 domain-containing protein n=1 Tax=Pelagovum pacificum TaxID=2588711 RepID=A0A5C5GAG0_9RHOB|nr:DUF1127 domain-containing protein [Pelagovum pacificum]QQA41672.1 DUF1127 domain-containing protein [Pelagovum pacificum]TNY30950.1 DUF1127 domain-containing protein [Pelagovum pacificum]
MAIFDTTRSYAAPRGVFGPGRAIARMVASLNAWHEARMTRTALSKLTAHELADIGLDHGDIDVVAEGRRSRR